MALTFYVSQITQSPAERDVLPWDWYIMISLPHNTMISIYVCLEIHCSNTVRSDQCLLLTCSNSIMRQRKMMNIYERQRTITMWSLRVRIIAYASQNHLQVTCVYASGQTDHLGFNLGIGYTPSFPFPRHHTELVVRVCVGATYISSSSSTYILHMYTIALFIR